MILNVMRLCKMQIYSKLGGEFLSNSEVETVRITVNNTFASKDVPNVIGVLRGSVEPDRHVLHKQWGIYSTVQMSSTKGCANLAFTQPVMDKFGPKSTT